MRAVIVVGLLVLSGCANTQEIKRPGGKSELLIGCGASTGWNICYAEANKKCPGGYETLSEKAGFNRKELRISCSAPGKPAAE